jgi:hypothetical protein
VAEDYEFILSLNFPLRRLKCVCRRLKYVCMLKLTGGSTGTKVEWLASWLSGSFFFFVLLRFRRLRYVCVLKPTGRSTERIRNGRELKFGPRNERKHP